MCGVIRGEINTDVDRIIDHICKACLEKSRKCVTLLLRHSVHGHEFSYILTALFIYKNDLQKSLLVYCSASTLCWKAVSYTHLITVKLAPCVRLRHNKGCWSAYVSSVVSSVVAADLYQQYRKRSIHYFLPPCRVAATKFGNTRTLYVYITNVAVTKMSVVLLSALWPGSNLCNFIPTSVCNQQNL